MPRVKGSGGRLYLVTYHALVPGVSSEVLISVSQTPLPIGQVGTDISQGLAAPSWIQIACPSGERELEQQNLG